jgi:hypothetical protein
MSTELGERLVRTIALQDAAALRRLLTPGVTFRALTPGAVWERDGADAVVDDVILGRWFSSDRSVTEVLAVECARIGPVGRVGYRFAVRFPDGDYLIEQQAYFKSEDERISWLQILCSGFVSNA